MPSSSPPAGLGPNAALIGRPFERDLATPALVLDLPLFKANLARMAALAQAAGRSLRPHVKAHKSVQIARLQVEAGATGLCCATVFEAETMAAAGLGGILVTSPVTSVAMLARLVAARRNVDALSVVADSIEAIERLAELASFERPVGVLVDIDLGQRRTGVIEPAQAVALARAIHSHANLRYEGVQAYYGHLQHVPEIADRRRLVETAWQVLAGHIEALTAAGMKPGVISGGGTGTHAIDLGGPFTELQPGSYLFMDKQYLGVELAAGASPFGAALGIVGRVVSTNQPDRVIIDAGTKSMSTDAGPALVVGRPGASYAFMGDEHGAVLCPDDQRPVLGELIRLIAPHCDPTVNLHDQIHIIENGVLIDIWPLAARGYGH